MNDARRKTIKALISTLEGLEADIQAVLEEEQEYFDNMPEGLQGSERGEAAQEAIDALENAVSFTSDAHIALGEIQ